MVEFESYFQKKTSNKWSERSYFQQKPGQYLLIRPDTEQELIAKFSQLENDIMALIQEAKSSQMPTKVSNFEVAKLVDQAWDINEQKKVMSELMIDTARLPLAKL